jgi:hypothetical protein
MRPSQANTRETTSASEVVSPIYGDTLKSNEFRLACLTAVDDKDHPVHLTLEIYTHDNRPEYETVSYQWGGEDGDYSLRHPVFIGPYWDVLLQTKNCWSMLRFARPWRGVRMLWVDAVCISQRNLVEREAQVAKMGQIYEDCSRVLVYLGHDIVTASAPFPSYRQLHEFNDHPPHFPENHPFHSEKFTFDKFLQRKYFSRVWMIQELLYSERAVMRVGNVDYRADSQIMCYLEQDTPSVPWFGNLGRGRRALNKIITIPDLLDLTRQSYASDPRDLLFSVLGLVDNQESIPQVTPEYSISSQHFCVGIAAHLLLKVRDLSILYKARTLSEGFTDPSYKISLPSWLPSFGTVHPLSETLDSSKLPYQRRCYKLRTLHPRYRANMRSLGHAIQSVIQERKEIKEVIIYHTQILIDGEAPLLPPNPPKPWHVGARVCSVTGALALNLTHFFTFESQPSFICKNDRWGCLFGVCSSTRSRDGQTELQLTSHSRLDTIIVPGRDHLFCLAPETGTPLMYLLLRKANTSSQQSPKFRLVASDVYLFEAKTERTDKLDWPPRYAGKRYLGLPGPLGYSHLHLCDIRALQVSVGTCLEGILEKKNRMVITNAFSGINEDGHLPRAQMVGLMSQYFLVPNWQQLFPSLFNTENLDSLFFSLLRAFCPPDRFTEDAIARISVNDETIMWSISEIYLETNRKHRATLNEGFVELKFTNEEWSEYIRDFYILFDLNDLIPVSYWPSDSPQMMLYPKFLNKVVEHYLTLDWEWKHDGATKWCEAEYRSRSDYFGLFSDETGPPFVAFDYQKTWEPNNAFKSRPPYSVPQSDRDGHDVVVRISIQSVVKFLIDELREILHLSKQISDTYDPPLEFDSVLDMIRQGPTEEQLNMSVPKWLGGVKVDGSAYQVEII